MGKRLLFLVYMLFPAFLAWAQQRPLRTDDADLLEVGRVRGELGMEFLQKQRFSLSGLEGDLTRVGVTSLQVGVGEYAEFQISGVLQDFLAVTGRTSPVIAPEFSGNSTNDFGDIVLATKLKLAPEAGSRPALAFKFAVQLPNASQTKGLGNDETEFFAGLLLAKHVRAAHLLGNLGIAILGNPVGAGQADLLTYGAAFILPVHAKVNLVGEINGRRSTASERIANESRSQARVGIQIRAAGLRWDLAAIAGLHRLDPDSGVTVGMAYEFKAFRK